MVLNRITEKQILKFRIESSLLLLQVSIEGADFLKRWRWNRLLKRDRALWSHFPPETVLNGLDTTIL